LTWTDEADCDSPPTPPLPSAATHGRRSGQSGWPVYARLGDPGRLEEEDRRWVGGPGRGGGDIKVGADSLVVAGGAAGRGAAAVERSEEGLGRRGRSGGGGWGGMQRQDGPE
jgi:hypothetical protein